jgi:threonylcarbamoyladenosine tRNA methylthiotransferase MtaB
MDMNLRIHTFGCRLNQLESESIASAFRAAGFSVSGPEGDAPGAGAGIVVVNTCTVTSKSEQKARRLIRLALREDPRAVLIVTGCYAQMEAGALAALGDRVVVVPGSRKESLVDLPERLAAAAYGHEDPLDAIRECLDALSGAPRDPFRFAPGDFRFHSRASLKVEDGCDNACAFCRVHLARGRSVSLDPMEALRRALALEESGFSEIVLTGVNLSQYSSGGLDFPGLLSLLLSRTRSAAFRISSYEPDRIGPAFLSAAAHARVRPFFHLPVQSGSAGTLARMGRAADPEAMLEAIGSLRRAKDDPFISFDMISGFPGESQGEFERSFDFAQRAKPAWIHVFPYSPRPGTAALSLPDKVPERLSAERAARLAELARAGRADYARRWFGRKVLAVVEGKPSAPEGKGGLIGEAFTENALRVGLYSDGPSGAGPDRDLRAGQSLELRLEAPRDGDFDAIAFDFGLP